MALFSDIISGSASFLESIKNKIYNPISSQQTTDSGKQLMSKAENTAIDLIGLSAGGLTSVGKSVVQKGVTSFSSLPLGWKVTSPLWVPATGGAIYGATKEVLKDPVKSAEKGVQFVSESAAFGSEFTSNAMEGNIKKVGETIVKYPTISGGLAALGLVYTGYKGLNAFQAYSYNKAVNAQTESIKEQTQTMKQGIMYQAPPKALSNTGTTNKTDYKITEDTNDKEIAIAKIQAESAKLQGEQQLKAIELQTKFLEAQSKVSAAAVISPPLTAAATTPKKTVSKKKKKAKKAPKKKKKAKKAKNIKRRTTKRKK